MEEAAAKEKAKEAQKAAEEALKAAESEIQKIEGELNQVSRVEMCFVLRRVSLYFSLVLPGFVCMVRKKEQYETCVLTYALK